LSQIHLFDFSEKMEKSEFRILIKHTFLMGKTLLNQKHGLISVMVNLLHQDKWLRNGFVNLNVTVQALK